MVNINTNPDTPKTMPDTICVAADEAGRMSLQLLAYLRTGDLEHLRNAANNLLCIRSMETKNVLNQLVGCAMRSEHPLTDEERKELYAQLLVVADHDGLPA